MSQELTKARSQIIQVKSFLKQDKFFPAANALYEAVATILRNPLMKQEREEFERLIGDAVYILDGNPAFRKQIPLKLQYTPGSEKELLMVLQECLNSLQSTAVAEAKVQLEELENKKQTGLHRGQVQLDNNEHEDARETFRALVAEFSEDADLKADIGDRFLKAGLYEDAYAYISEALKDKPESTYLYNRIAISLRKLHKYETAEQYYIKALEHIQEEPNLCFNIGRLYVDWKKWDKVVEWAQKAVTQNPDFEEAQKMLRFAQKKLK